MNTSAHNENTKVISRDGMFAAALNGFVSYATGTDQELWRNLTATRLKIIMPDDLATNQGQCTAIFVYMVANITHNYEIEAHVLNLLRPYKGLHDEVLKIDYSRFDLSNETTMVCIIDVLAKAAFAAGVQSLKAGFDEIDIVAAEFGIYGSGEDAIKEALHGED